MRTFSIAFALLLAAVFAWADSAEAQSGSRSGGASAARRSAPSRSSGSSGIRRSASSLSGRGSGTRVPQRPQLSQAELQQIQLKQTLKVLGDQPNGEYNLRQNQLADEEASRDFESLKSQVVSPEQITSLTPLYRLGEDLVDPETQSLNWPEPLATEEYAATVSKLNAQIQNKRLTSAQAAKSFLRKLAELNEAINSAAAAGELELEQYVEARKFLTGVANEIRATDVLM